MKVVAISGWVKSGKDTAAEILIKDYGFKRIGFADALKDNVADQFDLDRAALDDQKQKELPLLAMPVQPRDGFSANLAKFMFREFRMQDGSRPAVAELVDGKLYGGAAGVEHENDMQPLYWTRRALCILEGSTKRTADPDYWVNRAVNKAKAGGTELVVISDMRYKNEMSAVKIALAPGDTLVTVRVNRFDTTESKDPSERDLDDAEFDLVIDNRGTLEDYLAKVTSLANQVVGSGL